MSHRTSDQVSNHVSDLRLIRAVVVDDEPLARRRLRTLLAAHSDFELVAECADGPEAVALIGKERPDLVFLDIRMVQLDGLDVVRALEVTPTPAVVFVTAYDQYAVDAFGVQALDYLLKPFDEERFVATLERVRRYVTGERTRQAHERLLDFVYELDASVGRQPGDRRKHVILRVGDLALDVTSREVRRGGVLVPLRPKEFDLLLALMHRPGEVVSKRELLQDVWGYKDDVVSRTIDTHMVELRRKLAHEPHEAGYIETVSRVGYRLHG
jgi:DNA-binding response OmpR family regulator